MSSKDNGLDAFGGAERLALAVLTRAVRDIKSGNGHAREAAAWLWSDGCDWLVGLGVDADRTDDLVGELIERVTLERAA